MNTDFAIRCDQACEAAEAFSKLFYETLDKNRHVISRMYLSTATLNWNGNVLSGTEQLVKFYDNLPTSEHQLETLDSQPVIADTAHGQTTIIVTVYGSVKFYKNEAKSFTQNFMLTSQENKWKIVTDVFRYQI